MIAEALRGVDDETEIRIVETVGTSGTGSTPFEIRPQQIVTLRLKTKVAVPAIRCLTTFDPVVPEHKRLFTRSFKRPEYKAYPPRTSEEMSKIL